MRKNTSPIVALITDFGTRDWYGASVKGRILNYCSEVCIVDITHDIRPGDIQAASYVLASCISDFPENTIFLCVVDPGVGTERKALLAHIGQYTVICPDNGLITHAVRKFPEDISVFYEILPEPTQDDSISNTFHGRDVFAPVAGKLAASIMDIEDLGESIQHPVFLDLPKPEIKKGVISGSVSYIDKFGNVVTNISQAELGLFSVRATAYVEVKGICIALKTSFGEVDEGQPLTYIGSNGFLEIGMNRRHAAKEMKLSVGCSILFYPEPPSSGSPVLKIIPIDTP
jgi:S-adenosyl-L-methionine hydrolase (adenosine-forming)